MSKPMTLGSLFDGIGGFPLAGWYTGLRSVWASEIEPFPIRVTEKRLPEVRHYGDIHRLNGANLQPVDIITFGSPCQDLSIGGRRSGLDGSRSVLFFEAVRIITEMRKATHDQYPKWAVWENVPGALSSRHGRDFREVLQSLVRVKEPAADVPLPESGRWNGAGEIMGDGYSLAWRVLDAAQGWGVPQRRKRIFLVLHLDGQRAGKVLFESEGLSGYSPPRSEAWQGAAGAAEDSAGAASLVLNDQGGARMDVLTGESTALRAQANGHAPVVLTGGFCTEHSAGSRGVGYEDERSPTLRAGVVPGVAIEYNPTDSRIKIKDDGICQTLCSRMGTGGNQVPLTLTQPKAYGISSDQSHAMLSDNPHAGIYEADTSRTLDLNGGNPTCNQGGVAIVTPHSPAYCMTTGYFTQLDEEKTSPLMARDFKSPPIIGKEKPVYALDRASFTAGKNAQYRISITDNQASTLVAEGPGAIAAPTEYLVRRLTPGECCRLQGFPDGWCENLSSPEPDEEEIARWEAVFEEWRQALGGKTKPKTRRQIVKWLKNPRSDTAEYKAYGNSLALPCVFFVLAGIVWAEETEE